MIEVATLLNVNKETAEEELKKVLEFERRLANVSVRNIYKLDSLQFCFSQISIADQNRRNLTILYNKYTVKELQSEFTFVSWLETLNGILPDGLTIEENESVIVDVPEYFTALGNVIAETEKRTIANYVIWRMIYNSSPYLTEKLRQIKVEFEASTTGRKNQEPRWKQCVKITTKL